MVGRVRGRLRLHPVVAAAVATGLAAIAVLAIARVTGADAVGRAFDNLHPGWIALIAVAELLTYPAYVIAYRAIAKMHGHAPLSLPLVARVVVAGFGPFSISGGFGLDKQALEALHEDEQSARVRVISLGVLEWAVLAPIAWVASVVFLATGENVMPSLLWPWAIGVPVGFGLAIWASSAKRIKRFKKLQGRRGEWACNVLEGVGLLRKMIAEPLKWAPALLGTALYWALDMVAFYAALRTFGLHTGLGKVIIAYATGYAATRRSLPLGGAGITEFLMTYALYWVRLPLAPALAAVVAYRAFNLLLAVAPALVARHQLEPLLSRRRGSTAPTDPPTSRAAPPPRPSPPARTP
jgi:uncharacterized membrane protein YbhN (UPF0104 family)